MRLRWALIMACALVMRASTAMAEDVPRIAIVSDGPAVEYTRISRLLAKEVDALLQERWADFRLPQAPTHPGDFSDKGVSVQLEAALGDPSVKLVIGLGLRVGTWVAKRTAPLPKPVLLPFAELSMQPLPKAGTTSGRHNLGYLTGLINLERELTRFAEVTGRKGITILVDREIAAAAPQLGALVKGWAQDSLPVRLLPVDPPAKSVLAALPDDTQAVYIAPLDRFTEVERQAVIDGLNARGLPTYAEGGRAWVERGALMTLTPADAEVRRMRRVALDIQEVLRGADPAGFSTRIDPREDLVINMRTARQIRVWPSFTVMTEATLLGQEALARSGPTISLKQALRMARGHNLSLKAAAQGLAAEQTRIREVRGGWLPSVDATANATWLDRDVSSSLQNAERELSWGLEGQQLLYDPRLHHSVKAQREAYRASAEGYRVSELDVATDTARAYLDVLRARTIASLTRDNLERIRHNLALAKVRVEIGSSGREDVLRWEVEVADSQADVVSAQAQQRQASLALSRLLNREELEAPFQVSEPDTPETGLVVDPRVRQYVKNIWAFRIFRDFMTQEALARSPELASLKAQIAAQEHAITAQARSLLIPQAVATGGVSHTFLRGGRGSGDADVPAGSGFPPRDDLTWQVGAGLRFNLYNGSRYPELTRARQQLAQLELERDTLAQSISTQVRMAMHQAGASATAVRLRERAAKAASANLERVVDAYRRGTVSIITLIDAQNQSLTTALAANNAVYDFLRDYVSAERATGTLTVAMSQSERDGRIDRLTRFAAQRDAAPEAAE